MRRAATATLAPRVANRKAVASPIPLEAPVTMATRPANGPAVMTVDMWFCPFASVWMCAFDTTAPMGAIVGSSGPALSGDKMGHHKHRRRERGTAD